MSRLRYICGICKKEKIDSQSSFYFYWDKTEQSVLKMCSSCYKEINKDDRERSNVKRKRHMDRKIQT